MGISANSSKIVIVLEFGMDWVSIVVVLTLFLLTLFSYFCVLFLFVWSINIREYDKNKLNNIAIDTQSIAYSKTITILLEFAEIPMDFDNKIKYILAF